MVRQDRPAEEQQEAEAEEEEEEQMMEGVESESEYGMSDSENEVNMSEEEDDSEPESEEEEQYVGATENMNVAFDPQFYNLVANCTDVNTILHYERTFKDNLNRRNNEEFHAAFEQQNPPPSPPLAELRARVDSIFAAPSTSGTEISPEVARIDAFWATQDPNVHYRRAENLWKYALEATRELSKKSRPVMDRTVTSTEFVPIYEDAITYLMNGVERPPQTWDTIDASEAYENERVEVLKRVSVQYHEFKQQRPGWHHKYGTIFPVQISFDTIDYLFNTIDKSVLDMDNELAECAYWHPEYDEVHASFRDYVAGVFILDPSFRREFVQLVKKLRARDGLGLEESDERAITGLFDQMNNMFNMTFEHFVIDVAENKRKKDNILKLRAGTPEHTALSEDIADSEQIFNQYWNTTDFPA